MKVQASSLDEFVNQGSAESPSRADSSGERRHPLQEMKARAVDSMNAVGYPRVLRHRTR